MTKVTMQDYDLSPDSDLSDEATQDAFFAYRIALIKEIVDHYRLTNEMIPMSTVSFRLISEFGITTEQHHDIIKAVVNRADDYEPEELDEVVPDELVEDFVSFIEKKLEERAEELDLFNFLLGDDDV